MLIVWLMRIKFIQTKYLMLYIMAFEYHSDQYSTIHFAHHRYPKHEVMTSPSKCSVIGGLPSASSARVARWTADGRVQAGSNTTTRSNYEDVFLIKIRVSRDIQDSAFHHWTRLHCHSLKYNRKSTSKHEKFIVELFQMIRFNKW